MRVDSNTIDVHRRDGENINTIDMGLLSGDKSIGGSDVSLQNECKMTQPPSSGE